MKNILNYHTRIHIYGPLRTSILLFKIASVPSISHTSSYYMIFYQKYFKLVHKYHHIFSSNFYNQYWSYSIDPSCSNLIEAILVQLLKCVLKPNTYQLSTRIKLVHFSTSPLPILCSLPYWSILNCSLDYYLQFQLF